jgi:hypothetical protein
MIKSEITIGPNKTTVATGSMMTVFRDVATAADQGACRTVMRGHQMVLFPLWKRV